MRMYDTAAEPNCVVIPMTDDGEIMVGNLNVNLGYLDNVYEAEIGKSNF